MEGKRRKLKNTPPGCATNFVRHASDSYNEIRHRRLRETPSNNKSSLIDMTITPYLIMDSGCILLYYRYNIGTNGDTWPALVKKENSLIGKDEKISLPSPSLLKKFSPSPQKYFITVTVKNHFPLFLKDNSSKSF